MENKGFELVIVGAGHDVALAATKMALMSKHDVKIVSLEEAESIGWKKEIRLPIIPLPELHLKSVYKPPITRKERRAAERKKRK